MATPHLLVISASARQGSLNRKLAHIAAEQARSAGLQVTEYDPQALRMPLYDGDLEAAQGVPAEALQLQQALIASDGLLLVTPEYNGFPTPLFINAFDWLSRIPATAQQPAGLAATANRPAALMSASPGPLGGLRALNLVRQYLQMAFQMIVVPQQFALGRAGDAFDDSGALRDAKAVQAVAGVVAGWAALASALKTARVSA